MMMIIISSQLLISILIGVMEIDVYIQPDEVKRMDIKTMNKTHFIHHQSVDSLAVPISQRIDSLSLWPILTTIRARLEPSRKV